MPYHFVRLLPFVFAGILCSILFPVDTTPPGGWRRPPPWYPGGFNEFYPPPGGDNAAADFQGLLTHFITALWNALHSIYDHSTTSIREIPHGARERTNSVNYRAMLWASARALGWAELDRVVQRTLSDIGCMTTIEGGTIVRQEEVTYVRRLITRILLELFSSFNPHAMFGPGLLDDISNTFSRSGSSPLSPVLDDRVASFVAITISHSASLASAVVQRIDEDVIAAEAFRVFASNPSSWIGYIQHAPNSLSIQEFVRNVHRSQGQIFSAPPIIPNSGNSHFASLRAPPIDTDLEAATGPFALCDEDIQYIAALLVAAIIRFHRRDGIVMAA